MYEMWESLTKLYQSDNENEKMMLREKLRNTKMTKTNTVVSYLTKLTQIHDQVDVVRKKVDGADLVRTALNGFSKLWNIFVQCFVVREHLLDW